MAPFSAPLGTIVGTIFSPSLPSVPVAHWTVASVRDVPEGIAGKASTAAAWSITPSLVYVFIVKLMSQCLARSWAVFGVTPERLRLVMNVPRRAWKSTTCPWASS